MSFSFGFGGDDIDDDGENEEQTGLVHEMVKHSISETTTHPSIEPITHTLRELVSFRSSLRGRHEIALGV